MQAIEDSAKQLAVVDALFEAEKARLNALPENFLVLELRAAVQDILNMPATQKQFLLCELSKIVTFTLNCHKSYRRWPELVGNPGDVVEQNLDVVINEFGIDGEDED